MRIGLDARTIYWPTRRGTGKNLIDLYRHLVRLRPHWQVVAYHRQQGPVEPVLPSGHVSPRLIEMFGDRVDAWQRWRLPMAAWRDDVDVLHCPANLCPTWLPVNTVVTIHDLIPMDMPAGRPAAQVRRFVQSVRLACQRAAWIICPSRYTRDRLVREFDADPRRMTVNPWAPDSSVASVPDSHRQQILARFGITKPFVLHFGAGSPRKNTRRVLEAWATLDKSLRHQFQLLVVGLDSHTQKQLEQTAVRLGIDKGVRLHGFAQERCLPVLLSAAQTLAYPSLSEGFGLPILDAWAVGTAVLTSDRTSMPEVAGDAAWLVDPSDVASIARGLSRLMGDQTLRRELKTRARRRLDRYSWEHTADRFVWTMEQVADLTGVVRIAS